MRFNFWNRGSLLTVIKGWGRLALIEQVSRTIQSRAASAKRDQRPDVGQRPERPVPKASAKRASSSLVSHGTARHGERDATHRKRTPMDFSIGVLALRETPQFKGDTAMTDPDLISAAAALGNRKWNFQKPSFRSATDAVSSLEANAVPTSLRQRIAYHARTIRIRISGTRAEI